MEESTATLEDGTVVPAYKLAPGETFVKTGPVYGLMTLSDGTQVNVTPEGVVVRDDQVADLCHQIGMRHVENGHPHDVDTLTHPETGDPVLVQRPFVYEAPDGQVHVGVGDAHGEHPLDAANDITPDMADPRIADARAADPNAAPAADPTSPIDGQVN